MKRVESNPNINVYYDPQENQIWEGVFFTKSDFRYYLIANRGKLLEITKDWIPERFIFLGLRDE